MRPVDHAALNLPTYPEIVKQPMDLGTVRQGIERGGVYSSCEEVNRDVALTFANAKLFNPPATDVHVMATTLEEFWAPRWEAIGNASGRWTRAWPSRRIRGEEERGDGGATDARGGGDAMRGAHGGPRSAPAPAGRLKRASTESSRLAPANAPNSDAS